MLVFPIFIALGPISNDIISLIVSWSTYCIKRMQYWCILNSFLVIRAYIYSYMLCLVAICRPKIKACVCLLACLSVWLSYCMQVMRKRCATRCHGRSQTTDDCALLLPPNSGHLNVSFVDRHSALDSHFDCRGFVSQQGVQQIRNRFVVCATSSESKAANTTDFQLFRTNSLFDLVTISSNVEDCIL